ncbi:acylphosphatase [Senegalia massiliensis]|uniref:acylphosphatase n=1 Tax=Senegalia massiliensis TaxID=1720316 RepID=UPI0010308A5A|nr:acylphosphatase [Senegalia massiliensis]
MKRVNIEIFGRVQGVGFRYYTTQEANKLNISGWVTNRIDGSVEIDAQGKEENIEKFIEWTKSGPSHARVDNINISEKSIKDLKDNKFNIK